MIKRAESFGADWGLYPFWEMDEGELKLIARDLGP